MINLDHVHFQHKTVIYFVQTFGNIYTIVPFCKHALRVFHAQGRSEGGIGGGGGGGGVNPPNFCRINIFGKSGWPFGKLRQ
jgi:hypothetical protein